MASGGTPGAWWRRQVQVPAKADSTRVSFLSMSAVYDPRQHGSILAIDYAEHCTVPQPSNTGYKDSWLALEQAGRRYVASERPGFRGCKRAGWHPVASLGRQVERDFRLETGPACAATPVAPQLIGSPPFSRPKCQLRCGACGKQRQETTP